MAPQKPHIVCIPTLRQGHINPMIKLINMLHSRDLYITLVLTQPNFATLSSSLGSDFLSLQSLHDFRIETIPDGFPLEHKRGVRELSNMALSFREDEIKKPFRSVLTRLLGCVDVPPISSIISDVFMSFALDVGKEMGIPVFFMVTISACTLQGLMHHDELIKRDESYLTNGYLDTPIDWIPGLTKMAQLKHLTTFIRTTNRDEAMVKHVVEAARKLLVADGVIFNTFDDLEGQVLEAMKDKIPRHYTVGPLALLCQELNGMERLPLTLSFWKEDTNCLEWLNKRSPKSVIYVNFGSLVILTLKQLEEFAWGLANSNHPFLWVIRSDLVEGVSSIINNRYLEEIKGRGLISSWCPQVDVLQHLSTAVFFTHCGWNSILESICHGVPMICWPYFADQPMNCLYACQEWKIAMEMKEGEVSRGKVERLVRELIEGEKGNELKQNALKWKKKAEEATISGGSSNNNFDELVKCLTGREICHQST